MKLFFTILAVLALSFSALAADQSLYNARIGAGGPFNGVHTVDLALDVAITPNWTLGPQFGFVRTISLQSGDTWTEVTSPFTSGNYSLGLRGNWFKNGAYNDGLYVGTSLSSVSARIGDWTEAYGFFARGIAGYGWFWKSFNIMLGGGLDAGLGNAKVKVSEPNSNVTDVSSHPLQLALEYSFGWTF